MKLTVFNGGLNLATASHLIAPNEAVHCVDVDFESGVLKPLQGMTFTGTVLSNTIVSSYYWFDGTGTYAQNFRYHDCETEWTEYQEKLFWTSACDNPKVQIGADIFDLGLTPPTFDLEFVVKQQQLSPRETALAAGVNLTPTIGSHELKPYVPNFGTGIPGTFAPAPGYTRHEIAYINITDVTLPPSQPTYLTHLSVDEEESYGITYTGKLEVDVTPPEEDPAIPRMNLMIFRKYNGRYIYITTMFNWYETIAPIIEDPDPEGQEDPTIYMQNSYSLLGTYTYGYTYYEPVTGAESSIVLLPEFSLDNELVWFDRSSIPAGKTIRIYRLGGDLNLFTLVGSTTYHASEYFVDNFSDVQLAGNPQYNADQVGAPPDSLRYLTELNAMFFGADNDKLLYTPIGNPYAWPALYYLDFPSEITGIGKTSIGLLVFTLHETWLVTGNSPTTLSQLRISGSQGCVKHHSVSYTKSSCLWLSSEGLCSSSGSHVVLQTRPRLGKMALKPSDVKNAVLHDEKYHCLLSSSQIFIADFNLNTFSYASSNVGAGHWLFIAPISDANRNKAVWMLTQNGGSRRVGSLFTNTTTNKRTWEYITGRIANGGLTKQKVYSKITAYIIPPMTFELRVNGTPVLTKSILASENEDIYTIMVPHDKTRGKHFQMRIYGTGEVHEIEIHDGDANA